MLSTGLFNTTTVLNVEINFFSLTVLLLIYLNINRKAANFLNENKLYISLIISNFLILIFDTIMWVVDGKTGLLMREVNIFVTTIYYILNPFICMVWLLYVDYQVYHKKDRLQKLFFPLLVPIIINTVLSFVSIFNTGAIKMFYFDVNNVYYRGNLFFFMVIINYFYLMYSVLFLIVKRRKISRQHFVTLLCFAFPPIIGGIIQVAFYGISLVWVCATISLLIAFINIQNNQVNTDHLTGVFNRRQLDLYLQEKTKVKSHKMIAGIMMDLDRFKMINDQYGHSAGDQALKLTAEILKKTFSKNGFIVRYGGDEFVAIVEIKQLSELYAYVTKIEDKLQKLSGRKLTPYTISLSMGYDIFDIKSGAPKFLEHIDRLMYENKNSKRML